MLAKAKQLIRARGRAGTRGFAVAAGVGWAIWLHRLLVPAGELTPLERFGFDLFQPRGHRAPLSEIQIIEMDQRSFRARNQETAGLWDRSLHAALLRKLTADHARVVVFDVLFDKTSNPQADQQFAEAVRAHSNVVLAATRTTVVRPGVAGFEPVYPIDVFKEAAAGVGMANIVKDRDGAVRRPFLEAPGHPSLPREAARLAGAAALPGLDLGTPRWLRYYGSPTTTLPRLSYIDAMEQTDGYFRDKAVFIGSALAVKRPGEETDYFRTPFTARDGTEAPGVAIVATAFLNLIRGDAIIRMPALVEWLALLGTALVATLACVGSRPVVATAMAIGLALGIAGIGWMLQNLGQLLFAWAIPGLVVVPCAWLWGMAVTLKSRPATWTAPPVAAPAPTLADPSEQPTLVAAAPASLMPKIPDHTLLRAVGRGAYGEVWLARNAIGLFHAVKIIHRREFADAAPYEREFRGVTKFMPISRRHPGFVHILHVGRDDEAGFFYCIMEAADDASESPRIQPETYRARNLANYLQQRRRLPPGECLKLGVQLASALDHLHKERLIHRDIKPGNIIFVDGAPKLADIGLVTDVPKEPGAVTYLGTMGYIAPEGPGTIQADIYSLGKVLYEAFSGLDREEFPNLPTSLLAAPDETFSALNEIILKACEPDPRRRYESATQLHSDLEALLRRVELGK